MVVVVVVVVVVVSECGLYSLYIQYCKCMQRQPLRLIELVTSVTSSYPLIAKPSWKPMSLCTLKAHNSGDD